MKKSLEERIEQLKLKNATEMMNIFGRLLVDNRRTHISRPHPRFQVAVAIA